MVTVAASFPAKRCYDKPASALLRASVLLRASPCLGWMPAAFSGRGSGCLFGGGGCTRHTLQEPGIHV